MNCPICSQGLLSDKKIFACSNHHGVLMAGGVLYEARESAKSGARADAPATDTLVQNTTATLSCPNCRHAMQKVDYAHTGVVIDACANCPYRWLDKGEFEKVLRMGAPKLGAKDLLFLGALDQEQKQQKQLKPNEKVAHFTLYRAVYGAQVLFGVPGAATAPRYIATMGMHGMIKMLLHSWFYRALLIVIIVVFAAIAFYMISVMN